MQSASDMFLGWANGPGGRQFYVRQLRGMKVSVEIEALDEFLFSRYVWLCSHVLARAHARGSGMAAQIDGYLGKSARFADAVVAYASGYADQVERDYRKFRKACRSGQLEAHTEEEFLTDFRV